MEELRKFQSSAFDPIARRKLIEDQNTILELTGKIQELQNVIIAWMIQEIFSRCWISTQWKFPRYQSTSVILTSSRSWRNAQPFYRNAEPQRRAAKHLGYTWKIGKRFFFFFCKSKGVFFSTLSAGIESMEFQYRRAASLIHSGKEWETNTRSQSAKNSVIFSGGDSSKNYGADQQRLQISDLHFDKFPTPATFACWKIRFKTEVCTCSQFPTEAMQWIKEVEMVDSVDDLMYSSPTRGISMPNFEVLDARIASALNKII